MGAASPMSSSLCQYCKLPVLIIAKKLLIKEKITASCPVHLLASLTKRASPANWDGSPHINRP